MTDTVQAAGLYARLGGVEYKVVSKAGWALWSAHPASGFHKSGRGYLRPIQPGEKLDSYRISHRGTYRGITVDLAPSTAGRVMAVSRDRRARDEGFDTLERDEWVKLIPRNDSELRFTTTRSPEPGPWMKAAAGSRRKP